MSDVTGPPPLGAEQAAAGAAAPDGCRPEAARPARGLALSRPAARRVTRRLPGPGCAAVPGRGGCHPGPARASGWLRLSHGPTACFKFGGRYSHHNGARRLNSGVSSHTVTLVTDLYRSRQAAGAGAA
jgi:hypothetical protein